MQDYLPLAITSENAESKLSVWGFSWTLLVLVGYLPAQLLCIELSFVSDGDVSAICLGDCLSFFTGADRIPPGGYEMPCRLNFSTDTVFPNSSTCALTLTLPTLSYESYEQFKDNMIYAFLNYGDLDCADMVLLSQTMTNNILMVSLTLLITLTLPTLSYESYEQFKDNMIYAFLNHGGFGLC